MGGHHNRILLAFKSSLPNEIEWAFTKLLTLSYEKPSSLYIDSIPGLIDTLLSFVQPFYDTCRKNRDDTLSREEYWSCHCGLRGWWNAEETKKEYAQAIQALLIIRNLSFEGHNARLMAHYKPLREILMEGITSQTISNWYELRTYCLNAVENMCSYITLRFKSESLLTLLYSMLFSPDRCLVLSSIRSLTNLASTEHNVLIFRSLDASVVERMCQLLLVNDEDLISACLDWFYQFTSIHDETALDIVKHAPGNFVKLMKYFLKYGAVEDYEDFIIGKGTEGLVHHRVARWAHLEEPQRCVEW